MSSTSKGHWFGWTGEVPGRHRSIEQEQALTIAQDLLTQAKQIDAVLPIATKVGLQQAKARVRRAALHLLFQNHAESREVVEVLHDLAFDEAEAGFWAASREAAQDAVDILLRFHHLLQPLPKFGYNQRLQNMSELLAELKGLSG